MDIRGSERGGRIGTLFVRNAVGPPLKEFRD